MQETRHDHEIATGRNKRGARGTESQEQVEAEGGAERGRRAWKAGAKEAFPHGFRNTEG